jgi:hypothetical protein
MVVFKVPSLSQDTEVNMEILFSAEPLQKTGIEKTVDDGKDMVIVNGKSVFILTDQGDFSAWDLSKYLDEQTKVNIYSPIEDSGITFYIIGLEKSENTVYLALDPAKGGSMKLTEQDIKDLNLNLTLVSR